MPAITGLGTTFNLPNYVGELYNISPTQTPFLSMIGNLNTGKIARSMQFACSSWYDLPNASQPAISESASASGVTSSAVARGQELNCAQIFQEVVEITYMKQSDQLITGLAYPEADAVANEFDWQIARKLEKIARDVEFTFINGVYNVPANATQAYKTRGIIEATKLNSNQTSIDANNQPLTDALFVSLLHKMWDNGAKFQTPVVMVNAKVKSQLSDIYGYAPQDRNIGGLNLKQIETDFGSLAVVLNPFVPNNALVIADVAYCSPVFVEVPDKGYLFYEPLAKTGASEKGMVYGQIGLDYTHGSLHGSILNIAVS